MLMHMSRNNQSSSYPSQPEVSALLLPSWMGLLKVASSNTTSPIRERMEAVQTLRLNLALCRYFFIRSIPTDRHNQIQRTRLPLRISYLGKNQQRNQWKLQYGTNPYGHYKAEQGHRKQRLSFHPILFLLLLPPVVPLQDAILFFADLHLLQFLLGRNASLKFLNDPLPAVFDVLLPKGSPLFHLPLPIEVLGLQLFYRVIFIFLQELSPPRHPTFNQLQAKLIRLRIYISPPSLRDAWAARTNPSMSNKLQKKVTLNDERHEVVFTLSGGVEPHAMVVYCKELQTSSQYCGSFRLADLEAHYQAIFQKIENLYHYISERTEEVEIESCDRIKVQLNFLKQSKEVTLKLSRMMMCSVEDNTRLHERVRLLESQNEVLKSRLGVEGGSGLAKFTLPLHYDTFNSVSYRISNFCEVSPIVNNYLLPLLKANQKTILPKNGLWFFHILISKFIPGGDSPLIELGVKTDRLQKSIVVLKSSQHPLTYTPQQVTAKEAFLQENDLLRIIFNVDVEQLVVERNFRVQKIMSWKSIKGAQLWPYIRLYHINVKSDIFIEEQNIVWGMAATLTIVQ